MAIIIEHLGYLRPTTEQNDKLLKALVRIKGRAQGQYSNPISVGSTKRPEEVVTSLYEVQTLLHVFGLRLQEEYVLLEVMPGYVNDSANKKTIIASLYDPDILSIVKEELSTYADEVDADIVILYMEYEQ